MTSIGFISARSLTVRKGSLWLDPGVGRIVNRLQRRFDRVILSMSVTPEGSALHDHQVQLAPADFRPLPYLPSVVGGIAQGRSCRRVIRALEREVDVSLVQLPFAAPTGLLDPLVPRVYHLCADIRQIVASSPWYRGWKMLPAQLLAIAIEGVSRNLISREQAFAFANGRDLLAAYPPRPGHGTAVVSSTLSETEVLSVPRQRTPDGRFRVLFVGHLRREKGFDVLLRACERVMAARPDRFELEVVGARNAEDRGMGDEIRSGLAQLERLGAVRFVGERSFGPDLFAHFADADVLVLPSLSEGTPRVLVEARAFGCPVIASNVGGVPTSVDDEVDGLLVPASDVDALSAALLRLSDDPALHQRLRDQGLARARSLTVERFADQMADWLEKAARLGQEH